MYDTSYFENNKREYISDFCLEKHVKKEISKNELIIDFYRIGVKLPFKLPIRQLIKNMPVGIENRAFYPYSIWVSWALKERFKILFYGNEHKLLLEELEALSSFKSFTNENDDISLCTAHFAEIFSFHIENNIKNELILSGAQNLLFCLEKYYDETWKDIYKMADEHLLNIPCIILISLSSLANALNYERKDEFSNKVLFMFEYWHNRRLDREPYSEGVAYDCYFINSFLEWSNSAINNNYKQSLITVYNSILYQVLHGKEEILAPIGDVEPEMTFFIDVFTRISNEFSLPNHIIEKMNLNSIPIYTLINYKKCSSCNELIPFYTTSNAISLNNKSMQMIISYPRCKTAHLHLDCGNFLIGYKGDFFFTDPGYQQYRISDEREYTISKYAHNSPIIDGICQEYKKAKIEKQATNELILDISDCYSLNLKVTRKFNDLYNGFNIIDEIIGNYDCLEYSFYIGSNILIYEGENCLIFRNNLGSLKISEENTSLSYKNIRMVKGSKGPLNLYLKTDKPLNLKIEICDNNTL